jgi:hypothetical protein
LEEETETRISWRVIGHNITFVNLCVKSSLTCVEVVQLSSAEEDRPWWKYNNRGEFSGKYFSKEYVELNGNTHAVLALWRGVSCPRAEFLVRFLMQEKLN